MFQSLASKRASANGFTLVELIITIVILGIVSAVVMPRILGSTTFNAPIIRDQIISLSRIAQQSALGRESVTLSIQPNAGGATATLTSSSSSGTINTVSLPISDVALTTDNTSAACGAPSASSTVSNATPLNINFGELGDLLASGVAGSEAAVNAALRICINDEPALSVCISPSGFAYAGNCDD